MRDFTFKLKKSDEGLAQSQFEEDFFNLKVKGNPHFNQVIDEVILQIHRVFG